MWLLINILAEKNVYNYKINNDFFDHDDYLSCPDLATCHRDTPVSICSVFFLLR